MTDPFVATLDKLTSGKEGNMVFIFTFVEVIEAKSTLYFKLYYFALSEITISKIHNLKHTYMYVVPE